MIIRCWECLACGLRDWTTDKEMPLDSVRQHKHDWRKRYTLKVRARDAS